MQNKELFKYLDTDIMSRENYKELFRWLIDCYKVELHEDFKYCFNITLKDSGTHIGWCGIGGLPKEFDFYNGGPFYSLTKEEYL